MLCFLLVLWHWIFNSLRQKVHYQNIQCSKNPILSFVEFSFAPINGKYFHSNTFSPFPHIIRFCHTHFSASPHLTDHCARGLTVCIHVFVMRNTECSGQHNKSTFSLPLFMQDSHSLTCTRLNTTMDKRQSARDAVRMACGEAKKEDLDSVALM